MLSKQETLKYVGLTILILALLVFTLLNVSNSFYVILTIGGCFIIYTTYIILKPKLEKGNIKILPPEIELVWKDVKDTGRKINKSKNYQEELSIYKTGIRFFNFFYQWSQVQELFFSKQIKGGKAVAQVSSVLLNLDKPGSAIIPDTYPTLTITAKERAFFIDIKDIEGFNDAIKKVKKLDLLK